ncbi:MAG: DUF4012 domain-containing protein, partial [Dehalococcoidia bacterium]
TAREAMARTVDAVEALKSFLGYEGPRNYLVLLQNQDEIRATGGFIGATIELPFQDGVLGEVKFEDSTRIDRPPLIDNPTAPEPIFWYLWIARLLFRDSNWNPDFPTAARSMIDFYENGTGAQVDGVIATTKLLALDLLDVVGTVRIPGVAGEVTREIADRYVEGELSFQCEARHVSTRGKRCFDEDLVAALLIELRSGLDDQGRGRLIDTLRDHLERKNVLLYTLDPKTEDLFLANGWGGRVPAPSQDFLMVIDSSLPGHTTDDVTRTWDYFVSIEPDAMSHARLRLRFENTRAAEASICRQAALGGGGCYWNYVRAFISPAAEEITLPSVPLHQGTEKLIWGHRELETASVLVHGGPALEGLVEVGGYVVVEPGSVLTMPVTYELDPRVVRRVDDGRYEYRLQLVKQPGIDGDQINVRLELPAGASVTASSPSGVRSDGRDVTWEGTLESDMELVVVFETG